MAQACALYVRRGKAGTLTAGLPGAIQMISAVERIHSHLDLAYTIMQQHSHAHGGT
jgi:hypothetical protein